MTNTQYASQLSLSEAIRPPSLGASPLSAHHCCLATTRGDHIAAQRTAVAATVITPPEIVAMRATASVGPYARDTRSGVAYLVAPRFCVPRAARRDASALHRAGLHATGRADAPLPLAADAQPRINQPQLLPVQRRGQISWQETGGAADSAEQMMINYEH
jgi:hypothetical protein